MTSRLGVIVLMILLLALGVPDASASAPSKPASPIKHIVVVMMHGATFDSYFGTRAGVDGKAGVTGPIYAPTRPLSDNAVTATTAYNSGAMNRFGVAQLQAGGGAADAHAADWQYTRQTAPGMWHLADQYVLFDHWFSSRRTDALPNALSLMGASVPDVGGSTPTALKTLWNTPTPTIFDRAQAAGVSWGMYIGKLRSTPRGSLAAGKPENVPAQNYWAPVLSMRRFWRDSDLRSGVNDQRRFYGDAATGSLPAISYVLPSPSSHLGLGERTAERRLLSIIAAVQKSPARDSTVVFVVFDSWGGYADHVAPPRVGGPALGFRSPVLMVSPLVRQGYVSSVVRTHRFLPAFIGNTFGFKGAPGWRHAHLPHVWAPEVRADAPVVVAGPLRPYTAPGVAHSKGVLAMYLVGLLAAGACLAALSIPAVTRRISP